MYCESVDSASPQSAELNNAVVSGSDDAVREPNAIQEPESYLAELSGLPIDAFSEDADADSVGLGKAELARVLLAIGAKCNYGLAPGVLPSRGQIAAFWRTLQLRDLALAHACALGRDVA